MTTLPSRRVRLAALLWATPLLLILVMFEILPLASVAWNSLQREDAPPSLDNYAEILGSVFQRTAFLTSIEISLATAAIGVALALPIANILRAAPGTLRQAVLTYANIGANFTGFPLAFAFIILFGLSGSVTLILARAGLADGINIYSVGGLILVYAYLQVQLGLLLIYPALGAITAEIEESAALMGASRLTFWWRIGLPVLAPSLADSFILLFANAMGTYATAFALVGGNANLVTLRIGELVAGDVYSEPQLADALAILLVLTLALPILVEQLLLRRRSR